MPWCCISTRKVSVVKESWETLGPANFLKRSLTTGLVRDFNGLTDCESSREGYGISPTYLAMQIIFFICIWLDWCSVFWNTWEIWHYYFLKMQIIGIAVPTMPEVLHCLKMNSLNSQVCESEEAQFTVTWFQRPAAIPRAEGANQAHGVLHTYEKYISSICPIY